MYDLHSCSFLSISVSWCCASLLMERREKIAHTLNNRLENSYSMKKFFADHLDSLMCSVCLLVIFVSNASLYICIIILYDWMNEMVISVGGVRRSLIYWLENSFSLSLSTSAYIKFIHLIGTSCYPQLN